MKRQAKQYLTVKNRTFGPEIYCGQEQRRDTPVGDDSLKGPETTLKSYRVVDSDLIF